MFSSKKIKVQTEQDKVSAAATCNVVQQKNKWRANRLEAGLKPKESASPFF